MSIIKKMIIGYFVIVVIPVLSFGIYFYQYVYDSMLQQFAASRQQIVRQALTNLQVEMASIQSVYQLMQYNSYVVEYLDKTEESEGNSVYTFIKHIQPLLAYPMHGYREMKTIRLYNYKPEVFGIPDKIIDISELPPQKVQLLQRLEPGQGRWLLSTDPGEAGPIYYYQHLYNDGFTEKLGLLEIEISHGMLEQFYEALGSKDNWSIYVLAGDKQRLSAVSGKGAALTSQEEDAGHDPDISADLGAALDNETQMIASLDANGYYASRKIIANQITINELDLRVVAVGRGSEVFHSIKQREIVLILMILLLLSVLSIVYYAMYSSIARRISRLARHMRTVGENSLRQFDDKDIHDEISYLGTSYNAMIMRIDELINNVHKEELRNREAAYKVLQAQVKPHFLYNTLESIRMLAIANNDQPVAEISFAFGQLMRYSLSSNQEHTTLAKELTIVESYLKIHKVRFRDRLHYDMDIQIDSETVLCPRFILQPLVENCIVHGLSKVRRAVNISITVQGSSDGLMIIISDDGAGIAADRLAEIREQLCKPGAPSMLETESGGLGLVNVNERIRSYYKGESRLTVDSVAGEGAVLTLYLDIRGKDNAEAVAGR